MLRHWLFLTLCFVSVPLLSYWSAHGGHDSGGPGSRAGSVASHASNFMRRELVQLLDRMVRAEKSFQAAHGRFTRVLSQLEVQMPAHLAHIYEITVLESAPDRLRLAARSDGGNTGLILDLITIDQDFRTEANFLIPTPDADYLRELARRNLSELAAAAQADPGVWEAEGDEAESGIEASVYRGFFDYLVKFDSQKRAIAVALGRMDPVQGLRLELDSETAATIPAGVEKVALPGGTPESMGLSLTEFMAVTGGKPSINLMNEYAPPARRPASRSGRALAIRENPGIPKPLRSDPQDEKGAGELVIERITQDN